MDQNVDSNGFAWPELMESTVNLWLSAVRTCQELTLSLADFTRSENYTEASMSMWRAFISPWTGMAPPPENPRVDMLEAFLQVMGPGRMSREMARLFWTNFPHAGSENIRQGAIKAWTGVYQKVVQPLLKIPPVGLTRGLQEKISQYADNFNTYQTALSEFQMVLSGPMNNSFADLREEMDRMGREGGREDDGKAYYGKWIKALEEHYATLFRSDEYHRAFSRLLAETAAFRISGNDLLTEFIQFLPVPTNKEMDELYREIYTLKKTTRETAKKMKKLESALAAQATLPAGGVRN